MSTAIVTEMAASACPRWCMANHPDEDIERIPDIHYVRVGDLGVEAWTDRGEDGSLNPVRVVIGDLIDTEVLTAEQARQLGADLIAAATSVDGAVGTGQAPAGIWNHGYGTGREHALKGWPSLIDDDWETGRPLAERAMTSDHGPVSA